MSPKAAGVELATAYVSLAVVTPSASFTAPIKRQFKDLEGDAERAGKTSGRKLGDGLEEGSTSVAKRLGGVGKKLAAPMAAGFVGGLMAGGVSESFSDIISQASKLEQSVGGAQAVFGKYADSVAKDSRAAANAVGLSTSAYNELITVTGAMLKNKGLTSFAADSKTLVGIGADLSATYGGSVREAMEALNAALRGESDPIERYGIGLNAAAVEAKALSMGLAGTVKDLDKISAAQATATVAQRKYNEAVAKYGTDSSQALSAKASLTRAESALEKAMAGSTAKLTDQQKATAALALIQEQSKDAHGAFAREASTYAGQQERANAAMDNAKASLGMKLLPAMTAVTTFIGQSFIPGIESVVAALSGMGDWVRSNASWLAPLAVALAAGATAWGVYSLAVNAATIATTIATAASQALAATIAVITSPVTLVVAAVAALAAGLYLLYQNNETFRNAVGVAWSAITAALSTAWQFIQPILSTLGSVLVSMLVPAFSTLGTIVGAVFSGIWTVITTAWNIIRPLFELLINIIRNVLVPTVQWFGSVIGTVFSNAGKIVGAVAELWMRNFQATVAFIKDKLGPVFSWLSDNVVRPAMLAIQTVIGAVWDKIRPIFDALANAVKVMLPAAFTMGRDAIGKVWDGLKALVLKPVEFVIDTVINGGLIDGYNKVIEGLHLGDDKKLQRIPWPPPGFAVGGRVPGYSPTERSDNVPAMLTADEHVIRQRSARRMRRRFPGVLEHINAYGTLPGYAYGGQVDSPRPGPRMGGRTTPINGPAPADQGVWRQMSAWLRAHIPWAVVTSSYRRTMTATGNVSNHAYGRALDLVGSKGHSMMELFSILSRAFPNSLELIHSPAGPNQIRHGKPFNYSGVTRSNHFDHVHWAIANLLGGPPLSGDEGGGFSLNPFDHIRGLIKGLLGKMPGGDTALGSMLKTIPLKLVDGVEAVAQRIMSTIMGPFGSDSSAPDSLPPGSGVSRWRGLVEQALGIMGQPTTLTDTVLRRMNQESGGNARAINNWDSNAKAGTPSKGLMQVIDPTYRAYRHPSYDRGVWDPMSNILASMRYAMARYGSLPAAYNRRGGYALGGIVGYANGGRVGGWSLTRRSDNHLASLTSGEWVHPSLTAAYYGDSGMRAIQSRAVPRSVVEAYADGGPVGRVASSSPSMYLPAGMSAVDGHFILYDQDGLVTAGRIRRVASETVSDVLSSESRRVVIQR